MLGEPVINIIGEIQDFSTCLDERRTGAFDSPAFERAFADIKEIGKALLRQQVLIHVHPRGSVSVDADIWLNASLN